MRLTLILIVLAVASIAQPASNTITVKSTFDFSVTGDGSSANWDAAPWIQIPSRTGARSYYQTKVKLLYSQTGIYCLFFCHDREITATLKEDFADLYNEDVVEVFFWPEESLSVYFEYELSPLNHELPIMVPNLKGDFFGWKPWHYEGNRLTRHAVLISSDEKGVASWTAEFFIPFTLLKPLLKEQPRKGTKWRANLYRIDYDDGTTDWSWQLTGKNFHDYPKFGTLVFD